MPDVIEYSHKMTSGFRFDYEVLSTDSEASPQAIHKEKI